MVRGLSSISSPVLCPVLPGSGQCRAMREMKGKRIKENQRRKMSPGIFSPCLDLRSRRPPPGDPGLGRRLPGLATPQHLLRNQGLDELLTLLSSYDVFEGFS